MVVIKTKYITKSNGAGGIKASAKGMISDKGFTVTIPYPHELSGVDVHFKAVQALITKYELDWDTKGMGYGSDEKGDYFFTFAQSTVDR